MEQRKEFSYKSGSFITKNRLEKLKNQDNPYGYNLESEERTYKNVEYEATHTNQNMIKNKDFLGKV